MEQLITGFSAGSAAILTNVCLLPLYPGMIVFLAGNANNERSRQATGWLGVLVLAGVLSMMLVIGMLFFLLRQSTSVILPVLLPVMYGVVIGLGGLMLTGRSPFARVQTIQAPIMQNPYVTAYLYGLLLGPMTLPCTGAWLVSIFTVGTLSTTNLVNQLGFFFSFGLGFGWPLVVLPLLALPVQRRFIGVMTNNYDTLTRASGVLLIGIGIFGFLADLVPVWFPDAEMSEVTRGLFWGIVIGLTLAVGLIHYRRIQGAQSPGAGVPTPGV